MFPKVTCSGWNLIQRLPQWAVNTLSVEGLVVLVKISQSHRLWQEFNPKGKFSAMGSPVFCSILFCLLCMSIVVLGEILEVLSFVEVLCLVGASSTCCSRHHCQGISLLLCFTPCSETVEAVLKVVARFF